ncbi:MAG: hypothetical protein V3T83_16005 [Acidobacteriota bacterium]
MAAQIDDDVIRVSPRIAEQALETFRRFPEVKQLTADVWQDRFTTGARPPMSAYTAYNQDYGLYEVPIDGWFSVYHRSVVPLILSLPPSLYCPLAGRFAVGWPTVANAAR